MTAVIYCRLDIAYKLPFMLIRNERKHNLIQQQRITTITNQFRKYFFFLFESNFSLKCTNNEKKNFQRFFNNIFFFKLNDMYQAND